MYRNKTCFVHTLRDKTITGAIDYIRNCKLVPKCILFQIGSNDLGLLTANNSECVHEKESMEELISIAGSKFPNATICVSELLPRSLGNDAPTNTYNQRVRNFNSWLHYQKLAKVVPQPHFSVGDRRVYTEDGIHLTPNGTAQLVRNYKFVLNELLGFKKYAEYDRPSRKLTQQGYMRSDPEGQFDNQFHINRPRDSIY